MGFYEKRRELRLETKEINTFVIQEYLLMRKTTKQLRTNKSFRFSPSPSPSEAHSLYAKARQLNLSESEFVRMALMEVIDRIQQN